MIVSVDADASSGTASLCTTASSSRGTYWLKGLTRPGQIFQLVVPDLPADFPPLLPRHGSGSQTISKT
jgi:hypothetical protein